MRIVDLNPDGDIRTWLIEDETRREAAIVDPLQSSVDRYVHQLGAESIRLAAVIDTHTHADYLSGAPELARLTGAPLVMHHQAARACVDRRVHDGDRIPVGSEEITVLSTSGHTHDSISLLTPDALIVGDLFHPGPAGHEGEGCADGSAHADTLRRLASLEPTLLVFPTHAPADARPEPLIAAIARATALHARSSVMPATSRLGSDFMPPGDGTGLSILRANATCTQGQPTSSQQATTDRIERISPAILAQRLRSARPPHVIDVRSPAEFGADPLGRIPGSLLVPLEHLEAEADSIKELGGDVVLTCRTTPRAVLGADALQRAGVANVSVLVGGIIAWRADSLEVEGGLTS